MAKTRLKRPLGTLALRFSSCPRAACRSLGFFLLLVPLLSACVGLSGEPAVVATARPRPTALPADLVQQIIDNPDLNTGARIFAENCTACHGAAGLGDGELVQTGQIPSIADFTQPDTMTVHTSEDIFAVITNGRLDRSLMPPWGGVLSESERWAVTSYVLHLAAGGAPIAAAPAAPTAVAEAVGEVRGEILHGTAGAAVPDDITVGLHILNGQMEEIDFRLTQPENGQYRFPGVPLRADQGYAVTVRADEQVFSSDTVGGDPAAGVLNLPVTLYETTDDPSVIAIARIAVQLARAADGIQVNQIVRYTNHSDRMYLLGDARDPESVHLTLPEGAVILNEAELARRFSLYTDGRTLIDTQPVLPGEDHLVRVVYSLPGTAATAISVPLNYPLIGSFYLMVPPRSFGVESDHLRRSDDSHFGTGAFETYRAEAAPAGTVIRFTLGDAPVPASRDDRTNTVLLIGAAGVLLVIVSAAALLRSRETQAGLVARIAALDEQHQAGQLDDARYQRMREALKARLTRVMASHQAEP